MDTIIIEKLNYDVPLITFNYKARPLAKLAVDGNRPSLILNEFVVVLMQIVPLSFIAWMAFSKTFIKT